MLVAGSRLSPPCSRQELKILNKDPYYDRPTARRRAAAKRARRLSTHCQLAIEESSYVQHGEAGRRRKATVISECIATGPATTHLERRAESRQLAPSSMLKKICLLPAEDCAHLRVFELMICNQGKLCDSKQNDTVLSKLLTKAQSPPTKNSGAERSQARETVTVPANVWQGSV